MNYREIKIAGTRYLSDFTWAWHFSGFAGIHWVRSPAPCNQFKRKDPCQDTSSSPRESQIITRLWYSVTLERGFHTLDNLWDYWLVIPMVYFLAYLVGGDQLLLAIMRWNRNSIDLSASARYTSALITFQIHSITQYPSIGNRRSEKIIFA